MRAFLEIEVEDVPGALRKMLGVLERANANITTITHARAKRTGTHIVVGVIFTVSGMEAMDRLAREFREGGWHVLALQKDVQFRRLTVGLVGNIAGTKSMDEMISSVNAVGANVSGFTAVMPSQGKESSALITFEAEEKGTMDRAMAAIEAICGKNGLLMVRPVV